MRTHLQGFEEAAVLHQLRSDVVELGHAHDRRFPHVGVVVLSESKLASVQIPRPDTTHRATSAHMEWHFLHAQSGHVPQRAAGMGARPAGLYAVSKSKGT